MNKLNLEEKVNVIKNLYMGNYIEKLAERDPKHYNELVNGYNIFETHDGFIVIIQDEKKNIDTTIWYDDETERPGLTEELFISHNMRKIRFNFEADKPVFIYNAYRENEHYVIPSQNGYSMAYSDNTLVRYLEDDEREVINELLENIKNEYINRLKRYFKRYQSKIHVSGYWGNR